MDKPGAVKEPAASDHLGEEPKAEEPKGDHEEPKTGTGTDFDTEAKVGDSAATLMEKKGPIYKFKQSKKFQFRLAIIVYEACIDLQDRGSNPTTQVTMKIVGDRKSKTIKKKGPASPVVFNEQKEFRLECSYMELINKVLTITVSKEVSIIHRARGSGSVGACHMELGMLFKETPHLLRCKWMTLTDSKLKVTGSILVSVQITGPGEEPTVLPLELTDKHREESGAHKIPARDSFIPGILTVRIFRAENLPQMDAGGKADPYCVIKFAQYKMETKHIKKSCDPEWNEEFQIPYHYPSMCDRIQLQVRDKESDLKFKKDDYIATVHLQLSDISGSDCAAFSPNFGPCFINLYGSQREYREKEQNKGKLEGQEVQYRGRILVQITSTLQRSTHQISLPTDEVSMLKISDLESKRLHLEANYNYPQKYKLFALLLSANMINPHDREVEFELSIGSSGYHLTSEKGTFESRTEPCKPHRYGSSNNYYMRWEDKKPCIVLDVELDDCSHRIEALNMLLYIADLLEKCITIIRQSHNEHKNVNEELRYFFDIVLQTLEQELPTSKYVNTLDKEMRKQRRNKLKLLKKDIQKMRDELDINKSVSETVLRSLIHYLSEIKHHCIEPQNSLPDVTIWMLCGNERVAVKRIPSHEIMYSPLTESRGKNCEKIQQVILQPPPVSDDFDVKSSITKLKEGAQLSLFLWLGLAKSEFEEMEARVNFTGANYEKKQLSDKEAKKGGIKLQRSLSIEEPQTYQFKAYLHQARDLYRGDRSGLSDPYCVVNFENCSAESSIVPNTVSPLWNQGILIRNVMLCTCGDLRQETMKVLFDNCVTIQVWDRDRFTHDEFLGEVRATPVFQEAVELQWLELSREGQSVGEILAGFELALPDEGGVTGHDPEHFEIDIPQDIAPSMETYTLEFLCWGVRKMKKKLHHGIISPVIELSCGGIIIEHSLSDAHKDYNLSSPLQIQTGLIPTGKHFPSISIRVHYKGWKSHVGTHVIKSAQQYIVKEVKGRSDLTNIEVPGEPFELKRPPPEEYDMEIFDWWSKYYSSQDPARKRQHLALNYLDTGRDTLKIYSNQLEDNFKDGLKDFVETFSLYHGKGHHDDCLSSSEDEVGCVKGAIRLYRSAEIQGPVLSDFFSTEPVHILVRVYIVEAFDLKALDILTGKSDPYLKVSIGDTTLDSKEDKIKNDLNPIFGKMFELPATLPTDHTLSVSVLDYDRGISNDMIGTTKIDVENRFYSSHHATCGIPQTVSVYGVNKWRDVSSPLGILYDWVKREGLPRPMWRNYDPENPHLLQVNIGSASYTLGKATNPPTGICRDPYQQLALKILRDCDTNKLPGRKPEFVPEHVETRTLYDPKNPNIAQGKLRMWVDIFDRRYPIPPAVCIAPRKAEAYELRVIVWKTKEVIYQEVSIATNEPMTDIYVKGWFCTERNSQRTDVHYRSLDGNGTFNWRFKFDFDYIMAENSVVIKEKEHFYSLDKTQSKQQPNLTIQIWDDDTISRDDFIGSITFDLSKMTPSLRRMPESYYLEQMPQHKSELQQEPALELESNDSHSHNNLFTVGRMKGWWPVLRTTGNKKEITGKVELEFEVLKKSEAEQKKAGQGRSEPNMNPYLHDPVRPETSFWWLTSPLLAWKLIIWKQYKWHIIGIILLIILIAIAIGIAYTLPSDITEGLVKSAFQ